MISKEEVKHIAKLARLGLGEKEIIKMQKELSKILDYIEKLKEVETGEQKINPLSSSSFRERKIENIMRKDEETRRKKTESKKLFRGAPEIKDGYLKVKSIL